MQALDDLMGIVLENPSEPVVILFADSRARELVTLQSFAAATCGIGMSGAGMSHS